MFLAVLRGHFTASYDFYIIKQVNMYVFILFINTLLCSTTFDYNNDDLFQRAQAYFRRCPFTMDVITQSFGVVKHKVPQSHQRTHDMYFWLLAGDTVSFS